jgi:purine-nucleoside phosphorylase
MNYYDKLKESAAYVKSKINHTPSIGLILGSGLGELADHIEEPVHIDYAEIPHFPVSTVEGHAGKLVIGVLEGKQVVAMQGRFHFYEGYSQKEVVLPVYMMKLLGIQTLVVTNAAGGMNRQFEAGDLMLITDHLNFTGSNPLIGANDPELGPRFPDMSQAYTKEYITLAEKIAQTQGVKVQQGVYAAISGPAYMTSSELTMLARLGGDAVGMSTAPEVIVASHCGLKVLGVSCITDMAIGEELESLTHEQVMRVANQSKPKFIALIRGFVKEVTTS